MVDERFVTRVTGVPPDGLVTLTLSLQRGDGTYVSQATYRADRRGNVNVAKMAPVSGDYSGIDAMGLVWNATQRSGTPVALAPWTDSVTVRAAVAGEQVASAQITRTYLKRGYQYAPVREDGLVGTLFRPPGSRPRPAVIVVGGSEGGMAFSELQAALLASHGYDALALAYFDPTGTLGGGLPRELSRIPLEYFGTAIQWLARQPTVNPNRLAFIGASRGGELALLVGSRYPQLRAIVAKSAASVAWSSVDLDNFGQPAWTEQGAAVPYLTPTPLPPPALPFDWWVAALSDSTKAGPAAIPVERINGAVLLVVGGDDRLWPSAAMAQRIAYRLNVFDHPYADQLLIYAAAGHAFTVPYTPVVDLTGGFLGGTPPAQASASLDQWQSTLRFLHNQVAHA